VLAADLGVSRTTTSLALERLAAEGYISPKVGSGTFVAHDLPFSVPPRHAPAINVPKNPPLSNRGVLLAASPPAAMRLGGPIRPFRIGVPGLDLFPIKAWTKLLQRKLNSATLRHLYYSDSRGLPELRSAIAEHVSASRGTRCSPDQVIVTSGAQAGMEFISRLLLDIGDGAFVEDPGYVGIQTALIATGATIIRAPVDEEGIDVGAISRNRVSARLVYVSPSHQFPLGITMSLPRPVCVT
jgi:GntR family transcriptional regulator / MocR family aminotransferase